MSVKKKKLRRLKKKLKRLDNRYDVLLELFEKYTVKKAEKMAENT